MSLTRRLKAVWEKNGPEIRTILKRQTPAFLRNRPVRALGRAVPVFVFHSVEPERFESQLRYLADNGYSSVTSEELDEFLAVRPAHGHRKVALTFDDATGSFWSVAYPLLKKYEFKAILFVVAGIVPDDDRSLPNLDDVWAGNASMDEIRTRETTRPLCTWRELLTLHRSGLIDLQSHSLTHAKIPISDDVVDFIGPDFDPYFFGNVDLPLSSHDHLGSPDRKMRLGAPVYHSIPRLSGTSGCFADDRVAQELVGYVESRGGEEFFEDRDWHEQLLTRLSRIKATLDSTPTNESAQESEEWMRREFAISKHILEERIPGVRVRHFCYPWFTGCEAADFLASDAGYSSVHYGFEIQPSEAGDRGRATQIRRYSEEYLWSLPGTGRRWPYTVWVARIRALLKRVA